MVHIVVCAENSVTQAGLTAIATTSTNQVIDQVSYLSDLILWLQAQTADLALVELPALTPEAVHNLVQITTEWSSEEAISFLLLLEEWEAEGTGPLIAQLLGTGCISMLPLAVPADRVQGAIAAIMAGFIVLHPAIAETLSPPNNSPFIPGQAFPDPLLEPLTPREIEVLNQLAAGLSNRAIASTLEISEHTVKFHISAILSKLGVASRTEAVAVGIRAGLVML